MPKTSESFKEGDVIEVTTDGSRGIVTSQNKTFLNVLFKNYRCIPIKRELVRKTGKYFDLSIIWDMVY